MPVRDWFDVSMEERREIKRELLSGTSPASVAVKYNILIACVNAKLRDMILKQKDTPQKAVDPAEAVIEIVKNGLECLERSMYPKKFETIPANYF